MEPPFTVAVRISIEVPTPGRSHGSAPIAEIGLWRAQLTAVRTREPTSRILRSDVVPSLSEAAAELSTAFANHSRVNTTRRAGDPYPKFFGQAFAIAQIVLLPDFSDESQTPSYSPGNELIGDPVLVRLFPWTYSRDSEQERASSEEELERLVAELPRDRWRIDDRRR